MSSGYPAIENSFEALEFDLEALEGLPTEPDLWRALSSGLSCCISEEMSASFSLDTFFFFFFLEDDDEDELWSRRCFFFELAFSFFELFAVFCFFFFFFFEPELSLFSSFSSELLSLLFFLRDRELIKRFVRLRRSKGLAPYNLLFQIEDRTFHRLPDF